MHTNGKFVIATPAEIIACKGDARELGKFIALSKNWINASAFRYSRNTSATADEWKTWLTTGIWEALERLDDRAVATPALVFDIAWRLAMNAHKSAYRASKGTPKKSAEHTTVDEWGHETARDKNGNEIVQISVVSAIKGEDGEMEDILIPSEDEGHAELPFSIFMESLKMKVKAKDYYIIERKLQGYTLQEIADDLQMSKQGVDQNFKKNLPLLREFA